MSTATRSGWPAWRPTWLALYRTRDRLLTPFLVRVKRNVRNISVAFGLDYTHSICRDQIVINRKLRFTLLPLVREAN